MEVLIDIGNTSATFGMRKQKRKFSTWHISTTIFFRPILLEKEIRLALRKHKVNPERIEALIICSVVPKAINPLRNICKKIFPKAKFLVIGKDLKIPIKNKYKLPRQVGCDRLLNALALKKEYKLPALAVDFGTAITIDLISKKGEYLGGVIVPGLNLSLKVLHENTALLPLLNPQKPKAILGRTTKHSILSGVFYGYSYLVDGLIHAISREQGAKPVVVATGGNLALMRPLCKNIDYFDRLLTLKGAEIAYNESKNRDI